MNKDKCYKKILKKEYNVFVKKVKIKSGVYVFIPYHLYLFNGKKFYKPYGELFFPSLETTLKYFKENNMKVR